MILRSIPVVALLLVAACSSEVETSVPDVTVEAKGVEARSEPIASCLDWNGTCTGLPEGAACGKNGAGTCFADVYGVVGFCTCYTPPPPPCSWTSGICGGRPVNALCRMPGLPTGHCQAMGSTGTATSCSCL